MIYFFTQFSRIFHAVFTQFSRSFHAAFTQLFTQLLTHHIFSCNLKFPTFFFTPGVCLSGGADNYNRLQPLSLSPFYTFKTLKASHSFKEGHTHRWRTLGRRAAPEGSKALATQSSKTAAATVSSLKGMYRLERGKQCPGP